MKKTIFHYVLMTALLLSFSTNTLATKKTKACKISTTRIVPAVIQKEIIVVDDPTVPPNLDYYYFSGDETPYHCFVNIRPNIAGLKPYTVNLNNVEKTFYCTNDLGQSKAFYIEEGPVY